MTRALRPSRSLVPLAFLGSLLWGASLAGVAHAQSRAIRRAFESAPFERCGPEYAGVVIRLSLVIHRDGTWLVAIDHTGDEANDARFEACAEALLFETFSEQITPAPRRAVVLERELGTPEPPARRAPPIDEGSLPPHDGRRGAVCSWGSHRESLASYPEPRACRAGLSCCYPCGVGGCDSVCQTSAVCESYSGMP